MLSKKSHIILNHKFGLPQKRNLNNNNQKKKGKERNKNEKEKNPY